MKVLIIVLVVVVVLVLLRLAMAARIIKQYEQGVLLRFGRVQGLRAPGFRLIIPFADVLRRVSLRIVTMPIQSEGIITQSRAGTAGLSSGSAGVCPTLSTCLLQGESL